MLFEDTYMDLGHFCTVNAEITTFHGLVIFPDTGGTISKTIDPSLQPIQYPA